MKARVNDKCDRSGLCADVCPEVFELGQDGKACVKINMVPQEAQESCREAERDCPLQAIEVEE